MRSFLRAAPSRPVVRSRRSAASMRGRSTRNITRGANPTADIKPLKETGRKRVLSETELVQIWPACEDDDYADGAASEGEIGGLGTSGRNFTPQGVKLSCQSTASRTSSRTSCRSAGRPSRC
jgi:hypothetical protein